MGAFRFPSEATSLTENTQIRARFGVSIADCVGTPISVDAIIERLTILRARMLPAPPKSGKRN